MRKKKLGTIQDEASTWFFHVDTVSWEAYAFWPNIIEVIKTGENYYIISSYYSIEYFSTDV